MDSAQLVFVEGGQVFTDSLIVSEVFEKDRRHVTRDIEMQLQKLREGGETEFSLSNFGQSDYEVVRDTLGSMRDAPPQIEYVEVPV